MADNGIVATQRTPPREQLQPERRHPGSVLSSVSGSAIKRITAGVRAAPDRRCQVSIGGPAFTLPVSKSRTKKNTAFNRRTPPANQLWPVYGHFYTAIGK